MAPISILYLEDSSIDFELTLASLSRAGIKHRAKRVQTEEEFTSALQEGGSDLILADYVLPSFDGVSALELRETTARRRRLFPSVAQSARISLSTRFTGAQPTTF